MESAARPPTLMIVTAHPDDESFLMAGTCARYAELGVRTILVCATLGEAGRCGDPPVCRKEELGSVRHRELLTACQVIGIDRVELLGYRDGDLAGVPDAEGQERIRRTLEQYRPESVVTFPPGGLSGHPDHKAVQRWTEGAVNEVARSGGEAPRLYYATTPHYFDLMGEPVHHPADATANVRIPVRPWLPRKVAALRCHRSQNLSTGPFLQMLEGPGPTASLLADWEYFLQVRPAPASGEPMADELIRTKVRR